MVLIILVVVVVAGVVLLLNFTGRKEAAEGYRKARFMSDAEIRFYRVFEEAVAGRYKIFAKPRLGDIIYAHGTNGSQWQSRTNKIRMKHVDFLLCDPGTLTPTCVIELDDSSHNQSARAERDGFVNAALKAAGIPVAHFTVKSNYAAPEISQKLSEALRENTSQVVKQTI